MKTFNYHAFNLVILDKDNDLSEIKQYAHQVYSCLTNAYATIGGCCIYTSVKHMVRSVARYKLVFNERGDLYACATYRLMPNGSYKCILIGANKEYWQASKEAVITIIKSDVVNYKHLYWIEASGPVAHWYKKYGAFRIPAVYAPAILGVDVELSPDNEYAYTRIFDWSDDPITKQMFGFPSKELFDELLQRDGYMRLERHIKDIYEKDYQISALTESFMFDEVAPRPLVNKYYKLNRVIQIIIDYYQEAGVFYNMTELTHKMLKVILDDVQNFLSKSDIKIYANSKSLNNFMSEYEYVCDIYNTSNVLKLQQLY